MRSGYRMMVMALAAILLLAAGLWQLGGVNPLQGRHESDEHRARGGHDPRNGS